MKLMKPGEDCFGHEVPEDMDADNCPAKAFQPK